MNLFLLIATVAALLSGPLIYAFANPRPGLLAFLDGFVLISIAGLVLLEVVPGTFSDGGWWSALFLGLGLLGPTAFEHLMTRARREAHIAALGLAVLGLVIHSIGDGAALAPGTGAQAPALALAVAIHSVPVGFVVWWLMYPVFGATWPALALAAMCTGTIAGYSFGIELSAVIGRQSWAWLQALVAGSILHVVFGRPHLDEDSEHHVARPPYEGLGNLAALVALAALGSAHVESPAQADLLQRLLDLSLESAPALLLAYAIGGFITGELPDRWVAWLGRGGLGSQAVRGMVMGLPLPICSCGVLPVYQGLVRRGAPRAAAIAFLIATPEVGLTALFVSLPLLGADYTLLRVGAAALLAVFVGWLLARLVPVTYGLARTRAPPLALAASSAGEHCGHEHHDHRSHAHAHPHAITAAPKPARHPVERVRAALRSGFVDLVDGTAPWILAGLVLAALIEPYVQNVLWSALPDAVEVLIFALIGMPIYVCAAGATPLVAVLIAAGVSPGAALAFLLTGPATNVATFGVLRQLHGDRLALYFAAITAIGAVSLGVAVNLFVPPLSLPSADPAHAHAGSPLQVLSLALLALLYAASLLRKGGRAFFAELAESARPA